jgi:hypothetical protein
MGLDISESLQEQSQAAMASQDECACEVWPDHWHALMLYLACRGQMEVSLGGMGGAHYAAARSVNVQQELLWLGFAKNQRSVTVALYRKIELEALKILNQTASKQGQ